MNCTIIKLKTAVNNDDLPVLGALQAIFEGNADGAIFSFGLKGLLKVLCVNGTISKDGLNYVKQIEYDEPVAIDKNIYIKSGGGTCSLIISGSGLTKLGISTMSGVFSFPLGQDNRLVTIKGLSNYALKEVYSQNVLAGRLSGFMIFNIKDLTLDGLTAFRSVVVSAGKYSRRIYGEVSDFFKRNPIPNNFQVYADDSRFSPTHKLTFDLDRYASLIGDAGVALSTRGAEAFGDLSLLQTSRRGFNSFSIGASNSSIYLKCSSPFIHIAEYTSVSSSIRVLQPMLPVDIDNFLIGLATASFQPGASITLQLRGARTTVSDAAVSTLTSKGVTVSLLSIS